MLRRIPFLVTFVRYVRSLFQITPQSLTLNFHKRRVNILIESFLKIDSPKKLQIGAQGNTIGGWLNVDILPKSNNVVYMDATKPFPFPAESIDYIYTEHMIEHISFGDAKLMLAECFRVLKKGGRLRVATPNLEFLINLYRSENNKLNKQYIHFSVERYMKNLTPSEDVYVINNFFRDWGHQFIHDFKSLSFLLRTSGFEDLKQFKLQESEDSLLQNLEQHGNEIGDEFNALETLIVEAKKM